MMLRSADIWRVTPPTSILYHLPDIAGAWWRRPLPRTPTIPCERKCEADILYSKFRQNSGVADTARRISGVLEENRVRVPDKASIHALKQDGYGDDEADGYHLKPFEALYLVSVDRLVVRRNRKRVSLGVLLEHFQNFDPDILSKYLIYRDLRTRGYVAKDGFGFGLDFRVYDRGDFGEKGSKLIVFGLNDGRKESASSFRKKVDEMAMMGKAPVMAVIERRGEIIYYKVNRVDFPYNKLESRLP